MKQGVIEYINRAKGYGFIKPTESTSNQGKVFFHVSDVVDPKFRELKVNDRVDYIEAMRNESLQAVDVVAYQS